MHMTISILIIQVTVSVVAMYMSVTVSSSNFIFLSLTDTIFHRTDQKTSEDRRHYIKFAFHYFNILPKLRYFEGRIYIKVG